MPLTYLFCLLSEKIQPKNPYQGGRSPLDGHILRPFILMPVKVFGGSEVAGVSPVHKAVANCSCRLARGNREILLENQGLPYKLMLDKINPIFIIKSAMGVISALLTWIPPRYWSHNIGPIPLGGWPFGQPPIFFEPRRMKEFSCQIHLEWYLKELWYLLML